MFLLKTGKSLGNCLFTCTGAMKYGHIFWYLSGHVDCKMFMLCSIPPDRGRFRNSVSRLQRWTIGVKTPASTEKVDFSGKIFGKKNTIKNRITKKTTRQEESPEKKKKTEFSSVFVFSVFFCWCFVFCFLLLCFCFFLFLVFWFVFCLLWFCFVKKTMKPSILCAVGVLILERSALPPHVW